MVADNIRKAQALTKIGAFVFPVLVTDDPENPWKKRKRPAIPYAHPEGDPLYRKCDGSCGKLGHGFYDATNDPGYVEDLFERYPTAEVGVDMGRSGFNAADIDVKRDAEGNILVDGFDEFDKSWLPLPATFSFDSISGAGGKQFIYLAPEGVNLGPAGRYRGIEGLDRRAGGSYSVWAGDVPTSRDAFAEAPEWLNDEAVVRSTAQFEGSVKDWYDSLEPGEPSLIVRAAMDRTREIFADAGNDFDHAAMVERQFEAVRLGAEGHPGVDQLLALIEELFMARTGSHSRAEVEWDYEFQEALASAVEKYGDAIQIRKDLPPYSLSLVPSNVRDNLISGSPGDKAVFAELLRELQKGTDDDLAVTSVLWNSPRTRDISREWGLEFVHGRVLAARQKPEPIRENPTLPDYEKVMIPADEENVIDSDKGGFLSSAEKGVIANTRTFIDDYLAASRSKGFSNRAYAVPAAWTALSMAFALKAVIPKGVNLGMNLWFFSLGESGTGKSSEYMFLKHVLDNFLRDGDGYYNLGALSSPEGILVELLTRDGKASMIFQDEASSFFSALQTRDYMKQLEYDFSNYYNGDVPPSNKISLKDLRGKSAETSFNQYMIATPDRLLKLVNTDMFATGFMARYNYTWAEPPVESDDKYLATRSEIDNEKNAPTVTFDLAADLISARDTFTTRVAVWGTDEAVARLAQAHKAFDRGAKHHEKYEAVEPAITRLGRETIWKCAALLALYRGETTFTLSDALVAISYGSEWYANLIRVVEATSESDFAADVAEIEAYIRGQGGSTSEARVMHRFRNMVRNNSRELSDRLDFLRMSGRVNRDVTGNTIKYTINGE